jgi:hypothetical protein
VRDFARGVDAWGRGGLPSAAEGQGRRDGTQRDKAGLISRLEELHISVPLHAVHVLSTQLECEEDGMIDYREMARLVVRLERCEREVDRQMIAVAQKAASELKERMARVDSYLEGKELQKRYRDQVADQTARLATQVCGL